jgi:ABC-2 type transport system ATP-binding protein
MSYYLSDKIMATDLHHPRMNKAVIEISNVCKSFGTLRAVNDLSVVINEGEYVALLGPNGAGKTTLIEMIEGIQQPDSGVISILGMDWKHNAQALHRIIGLSLQETKFIDKLTTEETLNLFGSFYGLGPSRTNQILDLVNLEAKRKTFTVHLSGGQRQRLAIGIALLNNPKVLLLDEPTTGLDPSARREVWKILEQLRRDFQTTLILTTHYMEEAEYLCERILIMDKGKFLAAGTLNELNTKYGEGDIIEVTFSSTFENLPTTLKKTRTIKWLEPHTKAQIFVDNIAEVLPQVLASATERGLTVTELSSRRMTLDDLFISMTGRHLNE